MSTFGRRSGVSTGLSSASRTCQLVNPVSESACQVSTFTLARSSDWPETLVRRIRPSADAHRPSTSQLEVAPVAVRPRTCTSTQLPPGVVADHEGTSSVSPKPDVVHGETQRPKV